MNAETYLEQDTFLQNTFGSIPTTQTLWLNKDWQNQIKALIDRPYHKIRIRYWQQQQRSAWILEEIGKERYITMGYVINNQQIEDAKVLVYRESRGWEVKQDFFTRQFNGATINNEKTLTKPIDNITGATLSVRAMKKMARLALYLDKHINATQKQTQTAQQEKRLLK